MQVAEYIVGELIKYGVTDTFGIPGGVILRLLHAMKNREPEINPHLNYNEQMAGFAACGYAQVSGNLGVAYATRGPGITNMITCIAEAYQESLPVLFITAHGNRPDIDMRFGSDQELDVVSMVSGITKYAVNVNKVSEVECRLHEACEMAIKGRKGPVLLDFSSNLWNKEIEDIGKRPCGINPIILDKRDDESDAALSIISKKLKTSKRPIILIGDGIRHAVSKEKLHSLAAKIQIPILSSRGAQDLLSGSLYYYGYIGSHGTRYSNFILSKADLIIAIGNRLAFPVTSESFSPIMKNADIIRMDIDEKEFNREIPTAVTYKIDARLILEKLQQYNHLSLNTHDWIVTCNILKQNLDKYDCSEPVQKLENFVERLGSGKIYVCDVGNNEFWFARAFEKVGKKGTVLYSKSYGTLGVALGRAIGVYYATKENIICVMGDQGFQYNIQELQYIVGWNLPIKIVVLNNKISGMILDHEKKIFGNDLFHVNEGNGYSTPNYQKIVLGYGMEYTTDIMTATDSSKKQIFYEISISQEIGLTPNLPKGNACQNMEPLIDRDKYNYLDQL